MRAPVGANDDDDHDHDYDGGNNDDDDDDDALLQEITGGPCPSPFR